MARRTGVGEFRHDPSQSRNGSRMNQKEVVITRGSYNYCGRNYCLGADGSAKYYTVICSIALCTVDQLEMSPSVGSVLLGTAVCLLEGKKKT